MRYYILFCQHYYYLAWLRQLVEFCVRETVQILNGTHFSTSLDTVIGTTARKRAERPMNDGSVPSNSNKFCSSAKVITGSGGHPGSYGSPFALTAKPAGCEVEHSCPSAEVKNEWRCTFALTLWLVQEQIKILLVLNLLLSSYSTGAAICSAGLLVRLHVSLGSYQ
jgi:hypothetical protein